MGHYREKVEGFMYLLRFRSKTTVITLLIIIIVSLSTILTIQQTGFARSNVTFSGPDVFLASINPTGLVQLQLNQTQVFIASTNRQDITITYNWSLETSSSVSATNQTNYLLITHGNQAVFKFLTGDLEFCWLNATLNSNSITANATATIQYLAPLPIKQTSQKTTNEPTNQPTITPTQTQTSTLSVSQESSPVAPSAPTTNPLLNADLVVQNNAKLHYQVINGTDGSIIAGYSSSSANKTLNNAIAGGGTIAIMSGDYSGARLIVPPNANIMAVPDVTGIKYASIADGARINEPNFNAAFGGYQTGAYTVTTNSTASATTAPLYLAFKPDNSIYYSSTNASYTLNSAVNNGGGIFIVGNLTLYSSIILSVSRTSLYSDGTGILSFNNINGLNITATEVTVSDLILRQTDLARTRTAIICSGNNAKLVGYETFTNLKLWGWYTALDLRYTISSQATRIDTTYSLTGLHIWGQSTNNIITNCQFSNYGTTTPTVLIERDDRLDISPEGNIITDSLIYGGTPAVYLRYAFANQISESTIDGWNLQGVRIIGRQDNSLTSNWIGASQGATDPNIAVEILSDSTIIKGNTLAATNWTIYVHNSKNPLITDNSFTGPALIDIYSVSTNGGSIANNNLSANSQAGIVIQNSDGLSLYGNTLTGKSTAINIITSNHTSITSNIINNTQQNCIILDGSSYTSITANSISNSGQQADNSYSDLWLVNNSTYNNISQNTIIAYSSNRSAWGILENSPADDYNMYTGNTLTGQASGAIGVRGEHSLRGANIPAIG
jgi:parallel beta-helix repeat protein